MSEINRDLAARIEWMKQATKRAKAYLKPGDRITVRRSCFQKSITVTFRGWDGYWACSATLSDIAALSIYKVNGVAISFDSDVGKRD